MSKYDEVVDYPVFVPAWICKHRANDPLLEVEVGSRTTLEQAVEWANTFKSARVVEAWQLGGLYHYGRVLYSQGPYLSEWRLPVEPFPVGGAFPRA